MAYQTILVGLVVTSVFSALAALFLLLSRERFDSLIPYLISLSAGTIFGGVFIHLVFRLAVDYTRFTGLLVIAGMVVSFLLEKSVHWHCHHRGSHSEPLPYVLAAGDSLHNVLDGILIATGFLSSSSAGLAATVAVIAHKIPKELGDFGVMIEGGFSRLKALGVNFGISAFMFLGAGLVLGISQLTASAVGVLLPLVIGNFVFIAGSDLLPELKDRENWMKHLAVFSFGVVSMYAIPYLRDIIL